ncbi:MAG: hypothetical protein AB7O80_01090 [Acetobacteraceae bacterium]
MLQESPIDLRTHPNAALLLQLLAWVNAAPRIYADTIDAWRTSCPRLPVWEDAIDHGLVRIAARADAAQGERAVILTAAGRALLDQRPN